MAAYMSYCRLVGKAGKRAYLKACSSLPLSDYGDDSRYVQSNP
jgi:hypothetical protein